MNTNCTAACCPSLRQGALPLHRACAVRVWGHSPAALTSSCGVQVVVQGIPWAHTDEDLAALFQEVGTVEQASVVYSKDGRSRVRHSARRGSHCAALCSKASSRLSVLPCRTGSAHKAKFQRKCQHGKDGPATYRQHYCTLSDIIVGGSQRYRLRLLHVMVLQGYGTVRFSSKEEAEKAIADFHGTELEGRALAVKVDKCALTDCTPVSQLCDCSAFWVLLRLCIHTPGLISVYDHPTAIHEPWGHFSCISFAHLWGMMECMPYLTMLHNPCAGLCRVATGTSCGTSLPGLR